METKIARLMTEVNAPMKVYEMTPRYYGAALIAVTTGSKFLQMLKDDGDIDAEFEDSVKGNEHKLLILPGMDVGRGVIIHKSVGHFIDGTIEDTLSEEGYVILDLGI